MDKKEKTGRVQAAKKFKVDAAKTVLRKVLFSSLRVKRDVYSFRNVEDFDPTRLEEWRSDIAAQGINTPLLVIEVNDDKFLVLDGHRRYFATKANIEKHVKGFSKEMEIPVHVLAKGASEQAKIARAISANVKRRPLPAEGRIKACCDLEKTGMPRAEIAKHVGVSETQVKRDIDLGTNARMMDLVKRKFISASTAASLLAVAIEYKRIDDLINAVEEFGRIALKDIEQEKNRRAKEKERALTPAELQPKSRLKADRIAAWKRALQTGQQLGAPQFDFFAGLIKDEKRKAPLLKISAIRKNVDDLEAGDLAKVAKGLATVLAHVAPMLRAKGSRRTSKAAEAIDAEEMSAQLLSGLQIEGLVQKLAPEEVEETEDAADDEEATPDLEGADAQDEPEAVEAVDEEFEDDDDSDAADDDDEVVDEDEFIDEDDETDE